MTQVATQSAVVALFKNPATMSRFEQMMGKKAPAFVNAVMAMANQNEMLAKCDPTSVFTCAVVAASLDLQVHGSLGQAYLIPYGNKCTFQIGYKGMKQLAMRSGLYTAIKAFPIYKGQMTKADKVNGYEFDFSMPDEGSPIGYYAFYTLANGYKEEVYWSREKVAAHRAKYSKARNSPWDTEFDAMACKTVLKQVLKDAPMSIEMQQAVIMDGASVTETEQGDLIPSYESPMSDEAAIGYDWQGIGDRLEAVAKKMKPSDYQNGLAIIEDKDEAAIPVLIKTIEAAEKQ